VDPGELVRPVDERRRLGRQEQGAGGSWAQKAPPRRSAPAGPSEAGCSCASRDAALPETVPLYVLYYRRKDRRGCPRSAIAAELPLGPAVWSPPSWRSLHRACSDQRNALRLRVPPWHHFSAYARLSGKGSSGRAPRGADGSRREISVSRWPPTMAPWLCLCPTGSHLS
jgi:hypothetical protein